MRGLLIAIFIALQLLLGWYYWQSSKTCCSDTIEKEEVTKITEKVVAPVAKAVTGPLLFNWSDGKTVTDNTWTNKKQAVLDDLKEGQKLEITGQYRSDEVNGSSFENVGVARAHETRKLFSDLPDDRFILLGKLVDDKVDKTGLFASATFANRTVNKSIKETADGTQIYFPFNSTNKLNDSTVERYLDDVAERVKASGERIRLTGHTDEIGSSESNVSLGQKRSDIVKRYLMSKGVASAKITAQSAGETKPIASNSSSDGRAKNRRTELQIIK